VYYKARYIERAKDIALNNGHQYHHAAILFRGRRIIKIGTNSEKTHPRFHRTYENGEEGSHIHAEMDVLRVAKPGDIITVMRWDSRGDITMSLPCRHCQQFIREAGIKLVIYSNWDGNFETMRTE
jgi:deoxycytidylate deaminase